MSLYERNSVLKTSDMINPPTKEVVDRYIGALRKYPEKVGIQVFLCGGYINHIETTFDVDFILYSSILHEKDVEKLKKVGDFANWAMALGQEYNLWVDMITNLSYDDVGNFFNWEGYKSGEVKSVKRVSTISYMKKDGKTIWSRPNIIKEIAPELYLCEDELPKEKQIVKHRDGVNQANYLQLVAIL